ncbi:hypothetical protein FACS1894130_09190 [Spirochaetia bacterium]|nr:hypothetical protein FACS1894130_09190 [Spirochaetia bacterium]
MYLTLNNISYKIFTDMKKIIFILLFWLIVENLFSETLVFYDYNGINIYTEEDILTFKKENTILNISLENIMEGRKNIEYKYVNSYFKDNNYYFLLSAKDWYYDEPLNHSAYGSGEIEIIFIIEISENMLKYNITYQYLNNMIIDENKVFITSLENSTDEGNDKHFLIMEVGSNISRYKVITINIMKLEEGFIIKYLEL